jgi:hypothetical protein
MKSSKWILGLMVAVLVMALAPSSFAQVNLQIFNTPSPQEVATARNAQISDPSSVGNGILVSGALIANSPLTATALTFTFPSIITSTAASVSGLQPDGTSIAVGTFSVVPASDPIAISGATGLFANVSIATVNWTAGTIQLTLPGSSNNTGSGTFRLTGVRIDVNGKTAPMTATASLSSSSNNYILSTTSVPIITSLGPGLGSVSVGSNGTNPNLGTALMFTNQSGGTAADSTAAIVIAEGFASAWRTITQVNSQGVAAYTMNGTLIRLTINGLPAGVTATLSLPGTGGVTNALAGIAQGTSAAGVSFNTAGGTVTGVGPITNGATTAALSSTNNVAYVQFNSTNLAAVESFEVDFALSGTPSAALTAGSISVAVTMGPIGGAFNSQQQPSAALGNNLGGVPPLTTNYVRFADASTTVTIGSIVSANTTLLIPYAVRVGAYDTGIAIANTTLDPFGASGGGATPSAGTLTITMFPRNATGADPSFAITTSSTVRPGVGLSTSGTLVAGGVWTGLMSDIMTAAGKTGDYFGYIFIQANFLNAHGAAYIFNGAGFTSATPVLVLAPPASFPRNNPVSTTTGAEILSF